MLRPNLLTKLVAVCRRFVHRVTTLGSCGLLLFRAALCSFIARQAGCSAQVCAYKKCGAFVSRAGNAVRKIFIGSSILNLMLFVIECRKSESLTSNLS